MTPYSGYIDAPGLQETLKASGVTCQWQLGHMLVSDLTKAQSIVSSYNPLPAIQQQALATVAATLASRIGAGFTYNGVLVACDDAAQGKINRVSQMASLIISGAISKPWVSRTWPPATGTTGVPLSTPQDMIAFGAAVGSYVADNEFYAAGLEAQILSSSATASSIAALDLTNANGTWPTS